MGGGGLRVAGCVGSGEPGSSETMSETKTRTRSEEATQSEVKLLQT